MSRSGRGGSGTRSRWAGLGMAVAVGALALLAGGCSDMITYATDAREAGLKAYNDKRYPDAAGAFRAALKQDPRDYESQYWLGMSDLELGSYQQALVAFHSCLRMEPTTRQGVEDTAIIVKALDGLAQAIVKGDHDDLEVGRVEQAAKAAHGAQAGRQWIVLAKVYRYRGLPDMALDGYNRACLSDPKNFDYLKEFGLYAEQLQQQAKAQQSLRQAYAINAGDTDVTAALRRLGVVPGPSLLDKADLNQPLLPRGPIPEVDWSKIGLGGTPDAPSARAATPARPTGPGNAAMPRD